MRLEPKKDWVVAIAVLHKKPSTIHMVSALKVTRCFLIEELSELAKKAGYDVGDIVIPKHVNDLLLHSGSYHRAVFSAEEIIIQVRDTTLNEYVTLDEKPLVADTDRDTAPVSLAAESAVQ